MRATDHGSAREEAERLVATALAAARFALSGGHGERLGAGGPDCCVCPVCRAIAVLREPSPDFAERLATGAGDLAAGVASLLRTFPSGGGPRTSDRTAPDRADAGVSPNPSERDVWADATRATPVPMDDGPGGAPAPAGTTAAEDGS